MDHNFPIAWINGIIEPQNNNFSNISERNPRVLDQIRIIYMTELVIAAIGLLGNLFCLIVLFHRSQRYLAKTPYLVSLATSDLLLLYFSIFTTRLKSVTGLNIPGPQSWCSVIYFMGYSGITLSSFVLALFTLNRVISVFMPTRYMALMSSKRVIISLLLLWLLVMGLHVPYLLALEPNGICKQVAELSWVLAYYRPILQISIMGYIPDVMILTGNLAIVVRLYRLKRVKGVMSSGRSGSKDDSYDTVIATCLWLAVFHLVTRVPLLTNIAHRWSDNSPASDTRLLVSVGFYLLATFNHVGNFILYIIICPSFRKTVGVVFCCQSEEIPNMLA